MRRNGMNACRTIRGLTLLELMKRKNIISENKFAYFDTRGNQLTAMLTALIKSIYTPKSNPDTQPR